MNFNYGLLRQKIKDEYGTCGRFAEDIGIASQRLSRLLNNQAEWSGTLIYTTAERLGIQDDLKAYFFTPKVHKD